jgi:hypothetical protein
MQEELNQFETSKVWEPFFRPKGHMVFGTKWVFLNELDESRYIVCNKA